ncbi:MAG: head maturation protease, ClpP-related [Clostridia bacterium]
MKKFWNFIKNEATDETPESIELRIEGDIVDKDDAWAYEMFGVDCVTPNLFKDELSKFSGADLTVWIDSYGGNVFAAVGIYNALKEHKGEITIKIDGKAMSAATIIAMAGDKILMSPVSIMMIHNPLTEASGYANDLRKTADVLDTIKDAIINAYELKTNRSRAKISAMMDDETYMSAKMAIKDGFADGMLYGEAEGAEQDISNFAFSRIPILNSTNDAVRRMIEMSKPPDDTSVIKAKLDLELQI